MYFSFMKKYYASFNPSIYQGIEIVYFKSKPFQFRWFTDCGEWFLYIHIGRRWVRFSSCGFMSNLYLNHIPKDEFNIEEFINEAKEKLDDLTDEEFDRLLMEAGIEICPYDTTDEL